MCVMFDMTIHVRHDAFICYLARDCVYEHSPNHDYPCASWRIQLLHEYTCASCLTWLSMCVMTHSYVTWLEIVFMSTVRIRTIHVRYDAFKRHMNIQVRHVWHDYPCASWRIPLTEEIRLQKFGSPDLSVFLIDLLSDRDSTYSRENACVILGFPVKTCLICMGTPLKDGWKFWQS